jgi:two-component system CheB/CheR fusion protein
MRIRPYRTLDNQIEGAVITFVDISQLKKTQALLEQSREFAESIVDAVRQPLIVLDASLRVVSANRRFYHHFGVPADQTEGRLLFDLGHRQWDTPRLRSLLEEVLSKESSFDDYEVTAEFEHLGHRVMRLNARRILQKDRNASMILLAIEDVTEAIPGGRADESEEQAS